jgi:5-methyltetrahydropteroyltriglutamate--homocysteine methyltransferase
MQRTAPPFRADHVGSLLRPPALKEARAKRERNEITAEALRAIEDREIERAIKKQEEIGLKLATDGEFRRTWWHFDFFRGLDGVKFYLTDHGIQFHGVQTKAHALKIDGKIGFSGHPMLEHFKFLKAHTRVMPKMTIPAPSTLHFRQGRAAISKDIYPDLDAFFDDVAKAYRAAIRAFYDAGCRYLQLDDTAWAMACDPSERVHSKERGDEPETLPQRYARLTNAALEGRPADMAITMHSCRGNFRSTFIASGGYEFVAEHLLGHTGLDGYFLEYDTDRAGGFEPLRYFPKATSSSCSASSRRRAACWKRKTTSSVASTRRPNMSRSISSVCRRNAALPRPRKAMFFPRRSNGRSFASWPRSQRKCGADSHSP